MRAQVRQMGQSTLRFLILIAIEAALVTGSRDANLEKITPWLLGINFSIALFSVNFTFFGYQLSKYKPIYSSVTSRQWLNIIFLLILPFLPLVIFLFSPDIFGLVALLVLPILIFSAFDNADLTSSYLNPQGTIKNKMSDKSVARYLNALSTEVEKEAVIHRAYLANRNKFQIPPHACSFEPGILGIESGDLWDLISIIARLSIDNSDYPVFRRSINAAIKLVLASYSLTKSSDARDNSNLQAGINYITRNRLRSVINTVTGADDGGIFLKSLSSELCDFLTKDETLKDPCSDIARQISCDAV